MPVIETGFSRSPQDLSHNFFQVGHIGNLRTLSCIPVVAGDSFQDTVSMSFKMSQLRRNLSLDSCVDVFSFFVPHRHVYGDKWIDFIKRGASQPSSPNSIEDIGFACSARQCDALGVSIDVSLDDDDFNLTLPRWRIEGYNEIFNNFFKRPDHDDFNIVDDRYLYGLPCCHLKNIWTAPLNKTLNSEWDVDTSTDSFSILDFVQQAASGSQHQGLDYFMSRYRDIMDSFGGHASPDVDNRPWLLNRTTHWSSGYDVDGTTETTLGQYVGRVDFPITHRVPRFLVPEHGAIWTVAVCRFPPIVYSENNYLALKKTFTYEDIACDPVIVGNQPPFDMNTNDISVGFTGGSVFNVAHSQWYREHPSFVSARFKEVEGFPFLTSQEAFNVPNPADPSFWIIQPKNYDSIYDTDQLFHYQIYGHSAAMALRNIPSSRSSFMVSP